MQRFNVVVARDRCRVALRCDPAAVRRRSENGALRRRRRRFFAYLYPSVGMTAIGMFPTKVMTLSMIWGLVELLVATVAGAWPYQETFGSAAARTGV